MVGILRAAGLVWAETMMEGVFFIMQTYFTDVWKLSFTNTATILNIWGGLYRILPFFFLFLADTLLGNFSTLALSGIFSTVGIVIITVATMPVFGNIVSGGKCRGKVETECVGNTEKAIFITGMVLIALGRAARFASTEPFIHDQDHANGDDDPTTNGADVTNNNEDRTTNTEWKPPIWWLLICMLVFLFTPVAVIIAFPYIKKWYILFAVSACCTTFATIFYFTGACAYNKPKPMANGSPVTDIVRVFVAAAFNRSQPSPELDDPHLHHIDGQEFQSLSSTRILGFLHKAAINRSGEKVEMRSWQTCSVSEVESAKNLIRMIPIMSGFIMCGVVASIGNTYFIEQASHMNSNIGEWKAPLQLLLVVFTLAKYSADSFMAPKKLALGRFGDVPCGVAAAIYSVVCCAVAAAVERRRVHVLRGHDLLDLPDDGKVPMSAFWLQFQIGSLAVVESFSEYGLSVFLDNGAPKSMKRYLDCLVKGVTGVGYVCGALSVYVVGRVSQSGGGESWFQHTLNRSRLDRYYWVLTVLCSVNLVAFVVGLCIYGLRYPEEEDDEKEEERKKELALEVLWIKKGTAVDLIVRYFRA